MREPPRKNQRQMIEHYTGQGGRLLRDDRMLAEIELCGAVVCIDAFGGVAWKEKPGVTAPGDMKTTNNQRNEA